MSIKNKSLVITIIISFVFFLVIFGICAFRYYSLQYHDWDLALYSNGMWNLTNGNPYISIHNKHLLYNHFTPIAFLIAPLYRLFRTPLTLLFLQSFFLVFTTVPIYLVVKKHLNVKYAPFFTFVYLLFPSLFYVLFYEFHFESIAPFFLAMTFYFLLEKKTVLMLLAAFLAASCKENIPSVVAAIGLYGFIFRPGRRKHGALLLILGISSFLLITLKLYPMFSPKGSIGHASQYVQYGKGFGNVFIYMLTNPIAIIEDLFSTPLKIAFFKRMFSPLLFVPLLAPDILIITLPNIIKNLTSKISTNYEIYWHYTATTIPFVVFSLIFGIKRITRKLPIFKKYIPLLLSSIIISELLTGFTYFKGSPFFTRWHFPFSQLDNIKKEAISLIPENASCIATFDFLPLLSGRKKLYTFYCIWRGKYYKEDPDFDYALIDFNDYFINKDIKWKTIEVSKLFTKYISTLNPVFYNGNVVILKNETSGSPLVSTYLDPEYKKIPIAKIENSLELMELRCSDNNTEIPLPVTLIWKKFSKSRSMYAIRFFINENGKDTLINIHPIGYTFFIPGLDDGTFIKEKFKLPIPDELLGSTIKIKADIMDMATTTRAETKCDVTDENGFFDVITLINKK